jgi:putative transcriptional regulator
MISYHPDSRFLTDFASANLPISEAVCVSAHLELCGKCRAHVQQLADIGGHLLARIRPEEVEADSFDRLMSRVESQSPSVAPAGSVPAESSQQAQRRDTPAQSAVRSESASLAPDTFLPRALRRSVAGGLHRLRWVQLGKALRVAPLQIGENRRETALYDIRAGGRMPAHEHRGEEITVLLKGSFSDAEGSYSRGDFVVRNAGEAHQPTATQDMDCICLVSLERPVRPRALIYRLLEPFVQYRLGRAQYSAD